MLSPPCLYTIIVPEEKKARMIIRAVYCRHFNRLQSESVAIERLLCYNDNHGEAAEATATPDYHPARRRVADGDV